MASRELVKQFKKQAGIERNERHTDLLLGNKSQATAFLCLNAIS